jgi:hypothetical protein
VSASSRVPDGLLPRGSSGGYWALSISDLALGFVFSRTRVSGDSELIPVPDSKSLVMLCDTRCHPNHSTTQEMILVTLTAEHLSPIVALVAGLLILILPSLLNYVVAIYLIVIGIIGLNGIYHFIN